MNNITNIQEYRLRLAALRREKNIPTTDDEFVNFLMNTLDELVEENLALKTKLDRYVLVEEKQ